MEGYIIKIETGGVAVTASDSKAEKVLSIFGESLSLKRTEVPEEINNRIILSSAGTDVIINGSKKKDNFNNENNISFVLDPEKTPRVLMRDGTPVRNSDGSVNFLSEEEWMWRQLSKLSALIGSCFFESGGFLIHSGLVRFDPGNKNESKGVLLAGASGSGKSTASGMFRFPWFSLSDDLTLVVRLSSGEYFAYPFPTWSRVLWKKDKVQFKSVIIERPVRLKTVIFIDRGPESKMKSLGKGEALCLLAELVKQANEYFVLNMERSKIQEFNKAYFLNLNNFVRKVKCCSHNLKIDDTFWKDVESAPEFRT